MLQYCTPSKKAEEQRITHHPARSTMPEQSTLAGLVPSLNVHETLLAMRRSRMFCASCLLLLFATLPTLSAATENTDSVAAPATLKVVMDDNYPPYVFRDSNGVLTGYLVDIWKLWGSKTGVRVELTATDWDKAQQTMYAGHADVIDTIFRTPQRERKLVFSPPYAKIPVPIYTHTGIGGITDLNTLHGFLVGVKAGDACAEKLEAAGITTLQPYRSYEALVQAAAAGQIRVFCLDEPAANYLLYRDRVERDFHKAFTLYTGALHRAVHKGDTRTLALLRHGFSAITPDELAALRDKWMGKSLPDALSRTLTYALWIAALVIMLLGVLSLVLRHLVRQRTAQLSIAYNGLERLTRLYAALSQCNQAIVRSKCEAELFPQICRDAVEFGGMKMAWIGTLDEANQRIKPVAAFGSGVEYLEGIQISVAADDPHGLGPTGTAIRENRPVWCQDFQHEPITAPWHERGARVGWGASASLPLHRNGVAIGAFTLYAGEANAFDEAARNLLMEMAMDISFALDNFVREAESRRANEALKLSEQHFRAYFDRAMVGMVSTSPAKEWLEVNDALCEMLGYSREELMGMTWAELTHPDDLAANLIQYERILSGEIDEYSIENRFIRKDGTIVHVRRSPRAVRKADNSLDYIVAWIDDITQRKQDEEHIQRLAHFDLLTGLPNRALFTDRISLAINMAQRSNSELAVMFLDLDHFKNVNDNLGHRIGDALLVEIAKRVKSATREEDTVSRLGGDEFILLLPNTDADGAAHVAEKLLERVAQLCRIEQHELVVTPSIGIAMYPDDGRDFETLSQCADVAMYRAKHDGRNNYRFFTAEMQIHSARILQLESALRHALVREELSLHFQPQISIQDGHIIGAEALLRWQHPELGSVPPAEFIPIAESSGQILQIGEWVLRTAVKQMKSWMDSGMGPMIIAVNLSAVQFRHPNLPEMVTQILDSVKLPAQYLELELTEGVAMHDPLGAIAMMDKLHERGIRMSIDDFGTGYSSLNYLKRFKVYKLKIDQSFVRDITDDPEDKAIVSAIISLADSLGLQTIAEGVETEGQLALLREQGCNEVQGYYFSKPLPAEQFEAFVRAKRQA
jgi:diguanylate cyclase (GGDEF)-like protein/PAS domain S-box-containing protein